MTNRPFSGTSFVDIKIDIVSTKIKRLVAVSYAYTPPWPFYDPKQGREIQADSGLDLKLEVLARRLSRAGLEKIPESQQTWVSIDSLMVPGLLKPKVHDKLLACIDESARWRDGLARKKAGIPAPDSPEAL